VHVYKHGQYYVLSTRQMADAWGFADHQDGGQLYKTQSDRALWGAVMFDNDVELVRQALGNGANAAMVDPYEHHSRFTVLSAAVQFGGTDIVKLLLENGAEPTDAVTEHELFMYSSLMIGLNRHSLDSLRYLFSRGVLDTVTVEDILDVMHKITVYGGEQSPEVMRICIQRAVVKGADLSTLLTRRNPNGYTLLHNVARMNWGRDTVELVCLLIEYGAGVLLEDNRGHTPEDLARLRRPVENNGIRVVAILEKERLRITKSTAFAMGHHDRLGHASMLAGLDPEVLRSICELAFEASVP
jgi:hypothetical protein